MKLKFSPALLAGCLASWLVTNPPCAQGAGDLQPLRQINHPTSNDGFGLGLGAIGTNRFVTGAPYRKEFVIEEGGTAVVTGAGTAYLYDLNTNRLATFLNPDPRTFDYFGLSVTEAGLGQVLIGAPYKDVSSWINGPGIGYRVLIPDLGAAYLFNTNGTLVRSFLPPTPTESDEDDHFGWSLARLGSNRILIGAPDDDFGTTNSSGKVFLFDLNGTLIKTIANPQPKANAKFGQAIAVLGTNRFVVGAPYAPLPGGALGLAYLFDGQGNVLKTNANPAGQAQYFGHALTGFGTNGHYAVGAPVTPVQTTSTNGTLVVHNAAGVVYLYDQEGTYVKAVPNPTPAGSETFGWTLSSLGTGRFLVGAKGETNGAPNAGAAYIYNADGTRLATINNPTPAANDYFGETIAGIGAEHLVAGAAYDNTKAADSGSVYIFEAPILEFQLGHEIALPDNVSIDDVPFSGPVVTPPDLTLWHLPTKKLFATKAGPLVIQWPKPLPASPTNVVIVPGINIWPTNDATYQLHVANSLPVSFTGYPFSQLRHSEVGTGVDTDQVSLDHQFAATGGGRSLVLLSAGNPQTDPIFFQLVKSVTWNDPGHLTNATAIIGEAVTNHFGFHNPACGGPLVVLPNSVYCAETNFYNRNLRSGPIIPVNTEKLTSGADDLVVAYYQKGTKVRNAFGVTVSSDIDWPWKPIRYTPQWPANPPSIIIASMQGSGAIDPVLYKNWDLYFQNDPTLPGFNPNDEHTLRRPYDSGEALFALRDDLGTANTSEAYVLMKYQNPATAQGALKVWRVVAEEDPFFFNYPGEVGKLIQAPFPLSLFPQSLETSSVSGPYWRDRKLSFWAQAAGDDGSPANIVMRFFYPVQLGFFFPVDPPAPGTRVPWLDLRAGTPGVPHNINYVISWPTNAPELHGAETLVKPKFGLPDISLQSSVQIVYQQSVAQGNGSSVKLIDPTRERQVNLAALPSDAAAVNEAGTIYFPTLPPQLRNRFRYDPINQKLKFRGEFVEPVAGEAYLLLNVLTDREKAILLGLSTDPIFDAAVNLLTTQGNTALEVPPTSVGFDSLALTAGFAKGVGFVTLAFGNSTNLTPVADPVSLEIIKVVCPLYRGEIKVIPSGNPFDEKLTLRHSGDFAGQTDDYLFEWRTLPPVDGGPSTQPPDSWALHSSTPPNGLGAVDITISGPGLLTLSDNYFICRYRSTDPNHPCGTGWSAWTPPQLAEGWIKRVLSGINPFEQKIQSYRNNQVNTIVSMISQAGGRWVGNVPLNQQAAESFGLIEIYETILKRGIALSIEGLPAVNYPPANDALLRAAGRISDLYMLLGNEAYADASDPTIAFGTADGVYGSEATSIHCFMNQTDSLLEEELALLRGRDDSLLPSPQSHPAYNRLIWNFTGDINGGEVAYALNYNIQNSNGDAAGSIDEADAKALYPQGHGDAWGHYLTAIKNYYRLLRSPNFTWTPRIEAVLVGGLPVNVDFHDERNFAQAAAARARTGAEIVNLTYRQYYVEDPTGQYQGYHDSRTNRAWGLSEWGARAAQGALFDWIVANAMLPSVDPNPAHSGIQKVDRTTVKELHDIASALSDIQVQVDNADNGLNPLGLAKNVLPFDIDPAGISQGKTHFEQIYDRAVKAMNNAIAVFNHANNSTQLLRRQADDVSEFQAQVEDAEADFNSRLIEIFGYPYASDIGPTGTYPTGYAGPDLYHYDYVDTSLLLGQIPPLGQTLEVVMKESTVAHGGGLNTTTHTVKFNVAPNGLGLIKPLGWLSQRQAPGEIQMARSDLLQARGRFQKLLIDYNTLLDQIEDQAGLLKSQFNASATEIRILNEGKQTQESLLLAINRARDKQKQFNTAAEVAQFLANAAAEALPKSVGTANDATSVPRGVLMAMGTIASEGLKMLANAQAELEQQHFQAKEIETLLTDIKVTSARNDFAFLQQLAQLEQVVRQEAALKLEILTLNEAMQQSSGRYLAILARGLRLIEDRLRFRKQTAAHVQDYRYKDMAFRVFRNDALQKYRAQFDLAARYVYMAARAYDYETCLSAHDPRGPGDHFLTDIIRCRSLGLIQNGQPQTGAGQGDAGLADAMARMFLNWDLVLKGQLGFNNPKTETGRFSLRSELFRVQPGFQGNAIWRETLAQLVVSNLLEMPEFQRFCIPFAGMGAVEPGIIIPISTTINFGHNFFGWPAGGGDNDYDSTHFATKIRSVGVWLANYNNLGGGMINTPRVYLIPVGNDILRSPGGGLGPIREWTILDQALPVPFPLSGNQLNNPNWIPMNDTLGGSSLAEVRKFGRFRAYHDSGSFNESETVSDSRLIGRSVWNSRWLLIIPAGTLHSDRNEGLERFINGSLTGNQRDGNGVSDIKLFFQTYAYSGN